MSPKNMHNLIVGCLLDLCENPKTVNHVLTWRGQNGSTAAHLFCEMWRNEEAEIGASRDENGAITGRVEGMCAVYICDVKECSTLSRSVLHRPKPMFFHQTCTCFCF